MCARSGLDPRTHMYARTAVRITDNASSYSRVDDAADPKSAFEMTTLPSFNIDVDIIRAVIP